MAENQHSLQERVLGLLYPELRVRVHEPAPILEGHRVRELTWNYRVAERRFEITSQDLDQRKRRFQFLFDGCKRWYSQILVERLPAKRRPTAAVVSLDESVVSRHLVCQQSRLRVPQGWCRAVSIDRLAAKPHTVSLFLAAEATLCGAPSTLGRRLAAILLMHAGAGLPSAHDALEVDRPCVAFDAPGGARRSGTPCRR